jgi:hypothetical protein
MRTHFDAGGLQVTDEWVRSGATLVPVSRIRDVWVSRPPAPTRRWPAWAALGASLAVAVAWFTWHGWLTRHWPVVIILTVVLVALFVWGVGLDLLTYHFEHRDHDLWISDGRRRVRVWRHNEIEVNKAVRAIGRAREASAGP